MSWCIPIETNRIEFKLYTNRTLITVRTFGWFNGHICAHCIEIEHFYRCSRNRLLFACCVVAQNWWKTWQKVTTKMRWKYCISCFVFGVLLYIDLVAIDWFLKFRAEKKVDNFPLSHAHVNKITKNGIECRHCGFERKINNANKNKTRRKRRLVHEPRKADS